MHKLMDLGGLTLLLISRRTASRWREGAEDDRRYYRPFPRRKQPVVLSRSLLTPRPPCAAGRGTLWELENSLRRTGSWPRSHQAHGTSVRPIGLQISLAGDCRQSVLG